MFKNHFIKNDPGEIWKVSSDTAIDLDSDLDNVRVLTPNIIQLPDKRFRMYYCGLGKAQAKLGSQGYILSAVSEDGICWVKEPGMRLPNHSGAEKWVVCPDVIWFEEEHQYRMYYQALGNLGVTHIRTAISKNGISWIPESQVLFDASFQYGSPRCIHLTDGTYRLYFHEYHLPMTTGKMKQNHIVSARSKDGVHFVKEAGVRIEQEDLQWEGYAVYAPEVLVLPDATYRMYYSAWSTKPIRGRIFSATSQDGLNWEKNHMIIIDRGQKFAELKVSEPCIMPKSNANDGFYIFYEACDSLGNWRILRSQT